MSSILAKENERVESEACPSSEIVAIVRTSRGANRPQPSETVVVSADENGTGFSENNLQSEQNFVGLEQSALNQIDEPTAEDDPLLQMRVLQARVLEWVAMTWFNYQPKERQLHAGSLAPETAEIIAHGLGIELRAETRSLSRLKISQFPCMVLDREGYAYLLLGQKGSLSFI